MAFLSILAPVAGMVVGSFLNVVIHRLPREESLWSPPSHCPQCKIPIRWRDNIPVVSFLFLGGKCRECRRKISVRYPVVEGVCGLFFYLIVWRAHPLTLNFFSVLNLISRLLFVSVLIPVFFIDLEHQIIPDCLSYILVVSGILFAAVQGNVEASLIGAGIGAGIFLLILLLSLALLRQPGMGVGDVKLAAGVGAYLGWRMAFLSFFLSFLIGAVVAGGLVFFHTKGMKDRVAFGPFLVAGALVSLFLGDRIMNLYFTFLW